MVEHKDCVILMPTGGGKSLIFTIAAILKRGLTVITQPLKCFDGTAGDCSQGKRCVCILLQLFPYRHRDVVIHSLMQFRFQYVMLFTSPECIFQPRLQNVLSSWNESGKLAFIAIDEVHFIDSWVLKNK